MRDNAHRGGASEARRRPCRGLSILLVGGVAACGSGAPLVLQPRPLLVWNGSASAPIGLYRVEPSASMHRGDLVIAAAPAAARRLAAERGYLPLEARLLKHVAALGGDSICADGQLLFINGHVAARRLKADWRGLPLPWWRGCGRLPAGEFMLLGEGPRSFDARYFGPIGSDLIVGRARALWVR